MSTATIDFNQGRSNSPHRRKTTAGLHHSLSIYPHQRHCRSPSTVVPTLTVWAVLFRPNIACIQNEMSLDYVYSSSLTRRLRSHMAMCANHRYMAELSKTMLSSRWLWALTKSWLAPSRFPTTRVTGSPKSTIGCCLSHRQPMYRRTRGERLGLYP